MKKIYIVVFLTLMLFTKALAFDFLERGFSRSDNLQPFLDIRSTFGYRPGFLVQVDDSKYWALSPDGGGVAFYDLEASVNGWPLTRWTHEYIEPELAARYEDNDIDYFQQPLFVPRGSLACLVDSPLRYGDINENGQNELVLFLSNALIVFSPAQNGVIFMSGLDVTDWVSATITAARYEDEYGEYQAKDTDPQYVSSTYDGYRKPRLPGYRGYAKLYLGDFDDNGQHDILVWRKLYESNLLNDPIPGFTKISDTWLHYSLVDGEYQPVETDEATIQGWLSANDLTWSQGYPRYSECEGEEGQLIPEMHDPLLNDPDVLQ